LSNVRGNEGLHPDRVLTVDTTLAIDQDTIRAAAALVSRLANIIIPQHLQNIISGGDLRIPELPRGKVSPIRRYHQSGVLRSISHLCDIFFVGADEIPVGWIFWLGSTRS
jgi:hypothetical protein